ncbi:hypothetical protein Mapa_010082 [Marchantia paleacea]|nr:hypothetical protein Mapa_010082 [Marchantia paleacea]
MNEHRSRSVTAFCKPVTTRRLKALRPTLQKLEYHLRFKGITQSSESIQENEDRITSRRQGERRFSCWHDGIRASQRWFNLSLSAPATLRYNATF